MPTVNRNTKDYCPRCQQMTNHKCLSTHNQTSEYDADFHWEENYETIECLGCENIQFRNRYSHEDMIRYSDDGYEQNYDESKYYPKYLTNHIVLKNIYHLPDKIRIIYSETLEALKNNCYLLSGVGLRAIIEAICIDQDIAGRSLDLKINNLVRNKLITEKDGHRLHTIRFLGNDSVHDMDVPKEKKLRIALDIAENLLKNLYLIDIEVNEHLDTIISKYEDFRTLILKKIRANGIANGEEKNVKEILKKDFRRVEESYLSNFIEQLMDEIQNSIITSLSIGKVENRQQYFIKN